MGWNSCDDLVLVVIVKIGTDVNMNTTSVNGLLTFYILVMVGLIVLAIVTFSKTSRSKNSMKHQSNIRR